MGKLVPLEPTEAMQQALRDAVKPVPGIRGYAFNTLEAYAAMLSAAPPDPLMDEVRAGMPFRRDAALAKADAIMALEEERIPSEFLLILVPDDASGLEIQVGESATATGQFKALEAAKGTGYWRDLIGIYRHHGRGPLDGKWWAGPSTIYERRFRSAGTAPPSPPPDPLMDEVRAVLGGLLRGREHITTPALVRARALLTKLEATP